MGECYQLYCVPPLGSLVKTSDPPVEIYGVIYHAATSGIEPGRRPIARGREAAKEEDIYQANPQLAKLLRTEFSALVVGHKEAESLHCYLPPRPARIHSFVYLCEPEEVRQVAGSFDFLDILVNARLVSSTDEVLAACLRQMATVQEDRHAFLVAAGKELAKLLAGDLTRLNAILRRLRQ